MSQADQKFHFVLLRRPPEFPTWGGLEKLMLEWLERVDYNHCRVTLVISPGWKEFVTAKFVEKKLPVNVEEFPFVYKGNPWKKFFSLWAYLGRLSPSVLVYMQGSFVCFSFAYVLAGYLRTGGKIFMHENLVPAPPLPKPSNRYFGLCSRLNLWWYKEKFFYPLRAVISQKVFTVSQEMRDTLLSQWNYPANKVFVSYHGIDRAKFAPDPIVRDKMRQKHHLDQNTPVIISTARFFKVKALPRLLEAFELLSRDNSMIRLFLLGTGPLEDDLKKQANSLACKDQILFLGHQDNVGDYLKMSDIFVLSSDFEGLSLAFLEAMASGLICVSTDCNGAKEVIQDKINAFIVEKSVEGVRQGLSQAVSLTQQQRAAMSRNAIDFVGRNFDVTQNVPRVLQEMRVPC